METTMDYRLHENGWTVIIDDFDMNTATQDDINFISRLVSKYTLVTIKKQKLSLEKELEIIKMFKDPTPLFSKNDPSFIHTAVDPDGLICRVTAEKNAAGQTGIGANPKDFDWHANVTWRKIREPVIWLHAIKGTKGSCTSYNNNVKTWNDLPRKFKDIIRDYKLIITGGIRADGTPIFAKDYEDRGEEFNHPLLYKSPLTGVEGMFFPFLQVRGFKDVPQDEADEMIKWLADYTLQEKYVYHHEWDDGDITIADQWHGIHKRHHFVNLETRVLHRAAVYYPEQNYSV
jgi:alpha-ketoglutarate-dependent taurine dioxygenase